MTKQILPKVIQTLKNQFGIEKYQKIPEHLKLFKKEHSIFVEVDFEDTLAPHILKIAETIYPTIHNKKIPTAENLETISLIFGLSTAEAKIIATTWKYSKSLTKIHKATLIPKGSLNSILNKLEKRGLMINNSHWRANIPNTINKLRNLVH